MGDNMTVDNVVGLASMFGVGFTQKDTDTLQRWIDEEWCKVAEREEGE